MWMFCCFTVPALTDGGWLGDRERELLTNGGEDVTVNQGTGEKEEDGEQRQTASHQAYRQTQAQQIQMLQCHEEQIHQIKSFPLWFLRANSMPDHMKVAGSTLSLQ